MADIRTFRDLLVWQKGMTLVTQIYELTKDFPKEERYGLTSQMRRCAISIPSNIAEGHGRTSTKEYIQFLRIATGSLYELDTQTEIARNLNYIADETFEVIHDNCRELERMLSSLTRKLQNR